MFSHVIQKQVMEFHFSRKETAEYLDDTIREICYRQVFPRFNELFENLYLQDKILRIDKMFIDLGTISYRGFKERLGETILMAMEQEMRHYLKVIGNTPSKGKPGSEGLIIQPIEDAIGDTFVFFLDTGYFPWWICEIDWGEFEDLDCYGILRTDCEPR